MGKSAKIVDRSMLEVKQDYGTDVGKEDGTTHQNNDDDWSDRTDWERENFVYVY